jgi:alpha-tubulin suppressor-like RCC1 family protein
MVCSEWEIGDAGALTPAVQTELVDTVLSMFMDLSALGVMRASTRAAAVCALAAATIALVACTESPTIVPRYPLLDDVGQSDWSTVAVGRDHSCALKAGGRAYCWGSNAAGQLGVVQTAVQCGPATSRYPCSLTPVAVETPLRFLALTAGAAHTCGIATTGEGYCWGSNTDGQLGGGSGGAVPARIPGSQGLLQISAGYSHSCAVRADKALLCWGGNDRGQIGRGAVGSQSPVVLVPQMPGPVASVSAGQSRTCARTTPGIVYCWGAIWIYREGGLEYSRAQPTPELVPGAPAMASLSVGPFTTCGLDASGFGYCWEANLRGAMGNGTEDGSTTPQRIASTLEFVHVSVGIVQACGVVVGGGAYCWGDDTFGQLGVSPSRLAERCAGIFSCSTAPIAVLGRQHFTAISTGFGSHTCGVTSRGNLYCWGLGQSGQRGDGTTQTVSVPLMVAEPKPI